MIRRGLVQTYSTRQQQFCRRRRVTTLLLDSNVVGTQYCPTIDNDKNNKYRYSKATSFTTIHMKPQKQYINTIESTLPLHFISSYNNTRRSFYSSRWIEPVLETNCYNSLLNSSSDIDRTKILPSLSLSKRTMITKSMKKKEKQQQNILDEQKKDIEKNIDSEIAIQTEVIEPNFKGSTTYENNSSSTVSNTTNDNNTSLYEQQQQQNSSSTKLIHPFRTPLNSPIILPNTIDILDYKDTNEPTLFDPSIELLRRSMLESDTGSFDSTSNRSSSSLTTTTSTIGYDYKELYDPAIHLPSSPKVWDTTIYEETTPLTNDLVALLAVTGRPMSIAEYMKSALQHPTHGYYTNANNNKGKHRTAAAGVGADGQHTIIDDFDIDEYGIDDNDNNVTNNNDTTDTNTDTTIIGPTGDFITAPEITQMFGECIAIWFFANITYNKNNTIVQNVYDEPMYQWVEFGSGKGTMIADIIQFTQQLITPQLKKVSLLSTSTTNNNKKQKQKHPATNIVGYGCKHIHLIETSYELRSVQKRTLIQRFENDPDITLIFDENDDDDNNDTNDINDSAKLEQAFQESQQLLNSSGIINVSDESIADDNNETLLEKKMKNENTDEETIMDKLKTSIQIHWHSTLIDFQLWQKRNSVSMPTFFVGQEFLDALPIYAFEKTIDGYWRERMVDVATTEDDDEDDDNSDNKISTDEKIKTNEKQKIDNSLVNKGKKPRLRIVLAPEPTPALRTLLQTDPDGFLVNKELDANATVGNIVEVCPEAILLVQDVSKLLEKQGGAALFIDYGSAQGSRDSIRGYTNHEQVHFLSKPGYVDITADVDFAALLHAVNNNINNNNNSNRANTTTTNDDDDNANDSVKRIVHAFGPITQGQFLMLMGLRERAVAYVENNHVTEEEEENIYNAMMQLVAPEHMGERFKVLAITSTTTDTTDTSTDAMRNNVKPPPGFE